MPRRMTSGMTVINDRISKERILEARKQTGLRLWVGSFNLAHKDIFINNPKAPNLLDDYIPDGYDIYVLGVQEAINEGIFTGMAQLF